VQLSDFALVRTSCSPTRRFTQEVVTLWYRAPEVLMGAHYFAPVDVWAAGCVFVEMLTGKPLFPGICEIDQLFQIFSKLGTPNDATWPEFTSLPNHGFAFPPWPQRPITRIVPESATDPSAADLLASMLTLDPEARITARAALTHPFFDAVRDTLEGELGADGSTYPSAPLEASRGAALSSVAYVDEYLAHLRALDGAPRPRGTLPRENRLAFIDWLVQVVEDFDMSIRSVFLAVELFARYFDAIGEQPAPASTALLVSATCLHIASKCEDISYIGIDELVQRSALEFTEADVLRTELQVLRALDFRVCAALTFDFSSVLLGRQDPNVHKLQATLCAFLTELSLYCAGVDDVPRGTVAEAIVLFSGLFWCTDVAAWVSRFAHARQLGPVVSLLAETHQWATDQAATVTLRRWTRRAPWVTSLRVQAETWRAFRATV